MNNAKKGRSGGNNNPRRTSSRAFAKLEQKFTRQLNYCKTLEKDSNILHQNIENKYKIQTAANGSKDEIKIPLSAAEVLACRSQEKEKQAELKVATRALKVIGNKYSSACKRNSQAAQSRIKKFNEREKLSHEANRNSTDLKDKVFAFIDSINSKNDERVNDLKQLAVKDGVIFNALLYRILRTDFKDYEALSLINSNSSVRTTIFRALRENFGWVPKQ